MAENSVFSSTPTNKALYILYILHKNDSRIFFISNVLTAESYPVPLYGGITAFFQRNKRTDRRQSKKRGTKRILETEYILTDRISNRNLFFANYKVQEVQEKVGAIKVRMLVSDWLHLTGFIGVAAELTDRYIVYKLSINAVLLM